MNFAQNKESGQFVWEKKTKMREDYPKTRPNKNDRFSNVASLSKKCWIFRFTIVDPVNWKFGVLILPQSGVNLFAEHQTWLKCQQA